MPSRRKLLTATGMALVSAGTISSSANASQRGWKGVRTDPPAGDVEIQTVSYGNREREEDIKSGVWIDHFFGYILDRDTPEEAADLLAEIDFSIQIDGDELIDPKQYFGEIEEYNGEFEGDFITLFNAYTPPRSPGEYILTIIADTPDNYFKVEGTYEITPG